MRALAWLLLAVVAVEVGVWRAQHRTDAELRAAAQDVDPAVSLFALHVLANRDQTVPLQAQDVSALLASEHALVREFAMTWDGTRHAGEELQRAYLEDTDDPAEVARCDFYLRHQVLRPTLARLREYLAHSPPPR